MLPPILPSLRTSFPTILRYRFQPQPQLQRRIYQATIIIINKKTSLVFSTLGAYLRGGAKKALPPRRVLDEHELEEKFIRGSGPGGQKIV